MIVFADVEANGLDPDKIHCICGAIGDRAFDFSDMKDFEDMVSALEGAKQKLVWVFHNGLNYDVDVINKLTNVYIDPKKVIDTAVCSKLFNYQGYNTHSLKEIGQSLEVFKGEYTGGWEEFNEEMLEYCKQDVKVLQAIFKKYESQIFDPKNKLALRTEHDIAYLCKGMQENGFPFDTRAAQSLLEEVKEDMSQLEDGFRRFIGSHRKEVKRLKIKYKKDGSLFQAITDNLQRYPDNDVEGDEIVFYEQEEFNPGSPKQRIDVLWDYGWKPVDKTKGHSKWLRENK